MLRAKDAVKGLKMQKLTLLIKRRHWDLLDSSICITLISIKWMKMCLTQECVSAKSVDSETKSPWQFFAKIPDSPSLNSSGISNKPKKFSYIIE